MTWREEVAAMRRPSPGMTAVVSAALAAAWIGLRVVLFEEVLFPLTYVLPLMVSVWTRSTTALWLMAAAFALAQTPSSSPSCPSPKCRRPSTGSSTSSPS